MHIGDFALPVSDAQYRKEDVDEREAAARVIKAGYMLRSGRSGWRQSRYGNGRSREKLDISFGMRQKWGQMKAVRRIDMKWMVGATVSWVVPCI